MSDGQFLALYAVMVVMGAVLCLLTRALAVRAPAGLRRSERLGDDELHPVDLASLVSGPDHAALVAFLGLWQRGVLRPRDGTLPVSADGLPMTRAERTELAVPWEVVEGASGPGAGHPVEEAMLRAVGEAGELPEPSTTTPAARQEEAVAELCSRLRRRLHPRIHVHQRLMALGLTVDPATERRVYLAALWPLLVVGVGVARVIVHAGGNPVVLGALLLVAVIVLLAALRVPRVTPLGRWVVARAGKPSRAVAQQMVRQMASDRPYGTDDPRSRALAPTPWPSRPTVPSSCGARRPSRRRPSASFPHSPAAARSPAARRGRSRIRGSPALPAARSPVGAPHRLGWHQRRRRWR